MRSWCDSYTLLGYGGACGDCRVLNLRHRFDVYSVGRELYVFILN